MSATVISLPAAYLRLPSFSFQTFMYSRKRSLKRLPVGPCGSLERTTANTEPMVGVTSVAALISASHTAARAFGSLGRNLPDFSAQYMRIAFDWVRVIGFPPGPS